MTSRGPGVVQRDARILLDPRPVMQMQFVQVQIINGSGGFPSGFGTDAGTSTGTGSFSVNFS